ncbi:pectinesterase precursor [Colletotrichum tofieldiae]|nr:pectinesterase precursor [Colletotrichum tofieldiae]GKT79607.1 pectinesterase precursor [Colletotrichum tofieldiae]
MDSAYEPGEAGGLPSQISSLQSHRPMDLSSEPAQQSSCSQDEDDYDGAVSAVRHPPGGSRTTDTHVRSAAREKDPGPWRSLEACDGFDLRTWVVAPAGDPKSTTMTPTPPSSSEGGRRVGDGVFHRFPDLPYELRSKIWRIHLERPRIVVVRGVMDTSGVEASGNELGNVACNARWYCENRSPAIFRVCAESRREAMSFFRIHLPMRSSEPDMHGYPYLNQRNPAWDRIYINPDWDLVLYQGTSRSLTMPILASDLLAYDPLGEGVAHYGSNDWPKSIWHVNPDPGFGMATLNESFAFLKTFVLCTRSTSEIARPLGEGYVYAVTGEVGPAGMLDFGLHAVDWTRGASRLVVRTPNNSMIRKALVFGKEVDHSIVNNLVTVEMTTRIQKSLAQSLCSTTDGWVIRLAWQPPDRSISHVMHLTTGLLRPPEEWHLAAPFLHWDRLVYPSGPSVTNMSAAR